MKRKLSIFNWVLIFFSLCLLIAQAGWTAQKIFVNISGIPGESTAAGYENWIDASSYSDGLFNTGSVTASTGQTGGKVEFQPIQIIKSLDKASPKLRQAVATGQVINQVMIDITKSEASSPEAASLILVARIVLTNVFVTEISMTVNLSDSPREVVTFDFAKILFTYYSRGPDGGMVPIISSWDLQRKAAL